ncbi:hypothetical protein Tco_0752431 [Tanacetum coccineum]|uniref:Uncharacterized protein n=1 Tax=Tanacetum coccineum TaxID=301880 RepID=A0ABQ4Z6Z4_9ASTR
MQGTSCTQRKVSMVLFVLPSILLLVVIVVTVVIVVVIPVVVVVAVVGVVVVIVGSSVPSINKLSFVIVGPFSCYWSSACPSVLVSIFNICHVSSSCFQIGSNTISNQLLDGQGIVGQGISLGSVSYWDCRHLPWQQLVLPGAAAMPHYQLPDDMEMSDSIGGLVSLGDEIFSEGKESRELNIGGGKKTSMSKRYLVKSSEDSGETFLGEAGK